MQEEGYNVIPLVERIDIEKLTFLNSSLDIEKCNFQSLIMFLILKVILERNFEIWGCWALVWFWWYQNTLVMISNQVI